MLHPELIGLRRGKYPLHTRNMVKCVWKASQGIPNWWSTLLPPWWFAARCRQALCVRPDRLSPRIWEGESPGWLALVEIYKYSTTEGFEPDSSIDCPVNAWSPMPASISCCRWIAQIKFSKHNSMWLTVGSAQRHNTFVKQGDNKFGGSTTPPKGKMYPRYSGIMGLNFPHTGNGNVALLCSSHLDQDTTNNAHT